MKTLMIILSGVSLVNNQPETIIELNTATKTIAIDKIYVGAEKNAPGVKKVLKTTKKKNKKTLKKKKTSQKKKKIKSAKKKVVKKKATRKEKYNYRYNVGEIQNYMNILNAEYGWSNDDYIAWLMIVKRESSFNPYAKNKKSGATGLCQALPGKKMASHGKDWRTNYKTQLKWCRDYIRNRYKTPQQAWNFWQSHHWY